MDHARKLAAKAGAEAFAEVIEKVMASPEETVPRDFSVWFHGRYPTLAEKTQAVEDAEQMIQQAGRFYLPLLRLQLIGATRWPERYAAYTDLTAGKEN